MEEKCSAPLLGLAKSICYLSSFELFELQYSVRWLLGQIKYQAEKRKIFDPVEVYIKNIFHGSSTAQLIWTLYFKDNQV